MVGKVPSPGGSESQVPSIQERGSITGFSCGVSVERMKMEDWWICSAAWVEGEHETPWRCIRKAFLQLHGAEGDRAYNTVVASRSVFRAALGLTYSEGKAPSHLQAGTEQSVIPG